MEKSKELGKRILACIGVVIFLLSMTMLVTSITANAASAETRKAVKSVRVQVDNKNVTKKTSTLEIGKSKSLKVIASPKRTDMSVELSKLQKEGMLRTDHSHFELNIEAVTV